jgi:demethoxyubiquinone hydroxylase (CLK1/Coq7/Cat5 family)
MLSNDELQVLSYYRAGELAGSVLFGTIALHTTVDAIRAPLTKHCLEEAEHAWLWTKTIEDLGETPVKVTRTYQTEYGLEFGMPKNTLEVLCLTQVLERRVLRHFRRHLARKGTAPAIRATLQKMIDDEAGHIGWVWRALRAHSRTHGDGVVEQTMARLQAIDDRVYERLSIESPFREYFDEEREHA